MSIKYTEAYRKELIETLREASKIENPSEMEQKMFAFVIDLWRIIRKEETKSNSDVEFVSSEEAKFNSKVIFKQSESLSKAFKELERTDTFEDFIKQFNAQKDELIKEDTKGRELEGYECGVQTILDEIKTFELDGISWEEVLFELEERWRYCYKNLETVSYGGFAWNMNCGEILVCQFFLTNCDTRENRFKFNIDCFRESLRTL